MSSSTLQSTGGGTGRGQRESVSSSGKRGQSNSSISPGVAIYRNRAIIAHIMEFVGDGDDSDSSESLLTSMVSSSRKIGGGKSGGAISQSKSQSISQSKSHSQSMSSSRKKKQAPPAPQPAAAPRKQVPSPQSTLGPERPKRQSLKPRRATWAAEKANGPPPPIPAPLPPPPAPAPPPPPPPVRNVQQRKSSRTGSRNSTASSIDSSFHSSALSSSKRSLRSPDSVMNIHVDAPAVPTAPGTPQTIRREEEKQEIASATAEQQSPPLSTQPSPDLSTPPPKQTPQQVDTAAAVVNPQTTTSQKEPRGSEHAVYSMSYSSSSSSSSSSGSSPQSKVPPPPPPPPVIQPSQSSSLAGSYEEVEIVEEVTSDGTTPDSIRKRQPVIVTSPGGDISEGSELTFGTAAFTPGPRRLRYSKTPSRSSDHGSGMVESQGIVYEVIEEEIIESSPEGSPPEAAKKDAKAIEEEIIEQEVRFANPHVVDRLEYRQDLDSPLSVNVAHHVPPEHDPDFVPWYEQYYEELPWYEQPDLDEDDALTALCKKVLMASEDFDMNWQRLEERAVRVEARVINFALKLKNKRALRIKQQEQSKQLPDETPPPPIPRPAKPSPQRSVSSLISGPESVLDSSTSSSSSSRQRRHNRQYAFQAQQGRPSLQNIPPRAPRRESTQALVIEEEAPVESSLDERMRSSSHRPSWSFVDSGAIPKSSNSHLTKLRKVQSQPVTRTQPRQDSARPQRHSIAAMPRSSQQGERRSSGVPPRWNTSSNIPNRAQTPTPFEGSLSESPEVALYSQNWQPQLEVLHQGHPQRHSIATIPSHQRHPLDSGGIPNRPQTTTPFVERVTPTQELPFYAQQWQQQPQIPPPHQQPQGHPQRHSIAVAPSYQHHPTTTGAPMSFHQSLLPEHKSPPVIVEIKEEQVSDSSSSADDLRPIYERLATPQPSLDRTKGSRMNSKASFVRNSTDMNDESSKSQFSVPFDEAPYAKEFFQDDLYYESLRKSGKKRAKPRKISNSTRTRDPPAAAASNVRKRREPTPLHETRQQPDPQTPHRRGFDPMISNVVIPDRSGLERNMSYVSEISDVDFGPVKTPIFPESIIRTPSFPPPGLKAKIEQAEKQQQEMNKTPTDIPGFAKADIEELEEQWKAYSVRTSPTNSHDTVYTDDHLLSATSGRSRRGKRRGRRKGDLDQGSTRSGLSRASTVDENIYTRLKLREEERQRLESKRDDASNDGMSDDDMRSGGYSLADIPKQELTLLERFCDNLQGLCIVFFLIAVWVVVLIVSVTGAGSPTNVDNGGSNNTETGAPTPASNGSSTMMPQAPPTPSPVENPQLDGETLLPSWSWDVVQRDGDSPQYKAWEWLENSDTQGYSEERLVQRYAIATFYYATSPEHNNPTVQNRAMEDNSTAVVDSPEVDAEEPEELEQGWLNPDTSECNWTEAITCDADEQVDSFFFRSSDLVGTIPDEMGLLTNLLSLDLSANSELRGPIPTRLSLVTTLLGLDFHSCSLTGSIPTELAAMTDLLWLTLANQGGSSGSGKLSSTIPTELALLTNLEHLRLEGNQLSGRITPLLQNIQGLVSLVLTDNLLTGSVPAEVSRLLQLKGLLIGNNQLTGRIPDELSRMTSLMELHLDNNQIQSRLPASLNQLSNSLTVLTLGGNRLQGPLPLAWSSLSKLQVLEVNNNAEITGMIPVDWGLQWTDLRHINLQETALTGEVPVSLCFLKDDPSYSLESIGISCDQVACTCGCTCL
ncbi:LRR receptor-like serine threonine-protein kinase [Seminavis robusta]|uniref:LRR receptor-like serine threonine-protein kinase n=1 Tax=Seminavis robusta TaxID=568900 RepID=A0A9N8H4J6_9STRA|nr:LRR receptor-like serine threonine-protein kinase [Seminavis robusta]|eukprot:Sro9_g007490.1 LRR receptor-like serine threonine-protein kinase (1737) ;mRNA; r:159849-165059